MAPFSRRLQPSYRERVRNKDNRTPETEPLEFDKRHRRRWGSPPPERVLLGYVLSLSVMVALANLPLPANFLGSANGDRYSASGIQPDEPVPLITVQEISSKKEDTGSRNEIAEAIPVADTEADPPTQESRRDETSVRQAAVMRPVAALSSGTPSAEQTRKLLRHTTGPPSVDVPPKVRLGSMLVRYPLSALKKAIEGLVIVRFTVEPSGRASGVEVVKGLDPACDAEVVEAVARARFYPGEKEGRKVPAYSQMTVRFVLAESGSGIAF